MALTAGFEPAASPLGGEHSIRLSYASILYILANLSGSLSIIFLMTDPLGGDRSIQLSYGRKRSIILIANALNK